MDVEYTRREYCSAILMDRRLGLGAEEKDLLIKVVYLFGLKGVVVRATGDLLNEFCMSDAVFRKARNLLMRKGYLAEHQVLNGRKGRPQKGFCIGQKLISHIEAYLVKQKPEEGEYLLESQGLIDELLKPDISKSRVGLTSQKAPRPPVRILMSVLLAHADEIGVVISLGHADLRKLTGMERDRLVFQVSKLRALGFLRAYVPGITGGKLLGSVRGVYVLNRAWGGFESKVTPFVSTFYNPLEGKGQFQSTEAYNLYAQAREIKSDKANDSENRGKVLVRHLLGNRTPNVCLFPAFKRTASMADFFLDSSSIKLVEVLQWKIERYACIFLNEHWLKLSYKDEFVDERLLNEIASELLPARIIKVDDKDESLEREVQRELVRFIYGISHSIAVYIKGNIHFAGLTDKRAGLPYHKMNHLLLPKVMDKDLKSFCLLSFMKSGKNKEATVGQAVLINETNGHTSDVSLVDSMEDVSGEIKTKYGFECL